MNECQHEPVQHPELLPSLLPTQVDHQLAGRDHCVEDSAGGGGEMQLHSEWSGAAMAG